MNHITTHEHGPHFCYCPLCNVQVEVGENVKCNTIACPNCGTRMRAMETGEFRISQAAGAIIPIDDQPMDAAFFGEVQRLTDFITPDALEVQALYHQLTDGIDDQMERLAACRQWVASQVRYVETVRAKLEINGRTDFQKDYWSSPQLTIKTRVGNCAIKSFLLASLLRNELPPDQVYCTMGNLYNGKPGGHAWVSVKIPDEYIMESTTVRVPPLVRADAADRYEAVHYFNDLVILAVEGKTQLEPYARCFSDWLSDYLNWAYIHND